MSEKKKNNQPAPPALDVRDPSGSVGSQAIAYVTVRDIITPVLGLYGHLYISSLLQQTQRNQKPMAIQTRVLSPSPRLSISHNTAVWETYDGGTPTCVSATPPNSGLLGSSISKMGRPTPSTSHGAVQHIGTPVCGSVHAGAEVLHTGVLPQN